MPELPEVETIRRSLEKNTLNKTIKNIQINYSNILVNYKENILDNKKILELNRFGKFLIVKLSEGLVLLIHFRMEGKLFYYENNPVITKHSHIIFNLDNGYLVYNDTRKFGKIIIKNIDNYLQTLPLSKLGKEPKDLNYEDLYLKSQKSNKTIKEFLLDQTNISGLGNIYVDEVLYYALVKPTTKACDIDILKIKEIIEISKYVFEVSIENYGTTIISYKFSDSHIGNFQNFLKCHRQKTCKRCFLPIKKIRVGGRGTYYCENCQK